MRVVLMLLFILSVRLVIVKLDVKYFYNKITLKYKKENTLLFLKTAF